jgi:hypothetical protein
MQPGTAPKPLQMIRKASGERWGYSHDDTPHLVNGKLADTGACLGLVGGSLERSLESGSDDQSNDGSSELTNTLHSKDGVHHCSSPLGSSELGGNDGGQWVVTTDSDTLY